MIDDSKLKHTLTMINTSAYKTIHDIPKNISFQLQYGYKDIVSLIICYNNNMHEYGFIIRNIDSITDQIKKRIYYSGYKEQLWIKIN